MRRPGSTALGAYIDEHVAAFAKHPEIFAPAQMKRSRRRAAPPTKRIVPLLQERGRRGLVRRIHGDLHLGNIALIDGKPVLFDAIEFSDIIASGDVLLRSRLSADGFARTRLGASRQYRAQPLSRPRRIAPRISMALAALPFFLSMRAAIRAMVTAARMERAKPSDAARNRAIGTGLFCICASRHRADRSRDSSPSAGCPAPASRGWRGCSRRIWRRCPAP